ncbi:hypothetical protein H0H92_007048 [Tricholoma furcatifolium]|nr:hypothetical protein H0H92_007048 [Tricholoma furcatifolium]
MSPDERELLQGIGSDLLLKFYVGIGPMLLYGECLWSEHRKSWNVKATLFVVAFSLLAATGYLITLSYIPHVIPRAVMISDDGLSLEDRATLGDNVISLWSNAQIIIQQLPVEGADYVFSISDANALLTIATNALATCFIAYVLREYFKTMSNNLGTKELSKFRVWKILLLLFETGFAYCMLQILQYALSSVSSIALTTGVAGFTLSFAMFAMQIKFIVAVITALIVGAWAIPSPKAEVNDCGWEDPVPAGVVPLKKRIRCA